MDDDPKGHDYRCPNVCMACLNPTPRTQEFEHKVSTTLGATTLLKEYKYNLPLCHDCGRWFVKLEHLRVGSLILPVLLSIGCYFILTNEIIEVLAFSGSVYVVPGVLATVVFALLYGYSRVVALKRSSELGVEDSSVVWKPVRWTVDHYIDFPNKKFKALWDELNSRK